MEETVKEKNVFIGDDGVRATVTEEDRSTRSLDAGYGKDLMEKAGTLFCPIGAKYLGSAVIHYYKKPGLSEHDVDYFVACQTNVEKVAEGHADLGWKQLQSALMKAYARKEPRRRDDKN